MKVIVNRKQYNKVISETRGYSKVVENWADYVTDEILGKILKQDVKEDVYTMTNLSNKLKGKSFYEEFPVDSVILTVIINEVDGDDSSIDMEYSPYFTQIIENDDNTYNILDAEFDVVMTLPKNREDIDINTLYYYFSSFLSHEFMHLYEWVNRYLETPKEIKGCEGIYTNGDINGDAVDRIGYMIYVSQWFELNSFIQQAGTMITKRNPQDHNEFMIYLKELPFYNFAEMMINYKKDIYIKEIESLTKDRTNELSKIILCFYSEENKLPKMKSIDKFLSDVEKRFRVRGEYFKKKLLRLVTII
jgi:hypothetical protein